MRYRWKCKTTATFLPGIKETTPTGVEAGGGVLDDEKISQSKNYRLQRNSFTLTEQVSLQQVEDSTTYKKITKSVFFK